MILRVASILICLTQSAVDCFLLLLVNKGHGTARDRFPRLGIGCFLPLRTIMQGKKNILQLGGQVD